MPKKSDLQIEHGKTYLNGEGSRIRIRKESWDCMHVGIAENGTFMGQYQKNGVAVAGEPIANLVSLCPEK